MKIIDRYILGQTAVHFLFGITLFVTILTAGDLLFRLTRLWLQSGLAFTVVLQIFFYSIPSFLIYVFPMAALLAVLLTMSRLATGSEIIALKAGGVSLKRIALPFLVFAIWVCCCTIFISDWMLPVASVKLHALAGESALPDWLIQENTFFKDTSEQGMERMFYVKRVNRERSILQDVIVQEYDEKGLRRIINAEEAFVSVGRWVFLRGAYYEMDEKGAIDRIIRYEREEVMTRTTVEEMMKNRKKPQEMSFPELREYIVQERERGQQTTPLELMLWQKTAIPFACLVFSLVGVPLGLSSPRSGKSVGIGISILVVFGYYVFFSLSSALSEGGTLSPFFGAWFGNFLGAGVGITLLFLKDRH